MELQTSGMFYNGENNSKSIKIIVEEGLRDKQIFLDFETADGKKWKSGQIELDENGEALFPLPSDVLTGEGIAYIQAIAASAEDNGFIEKSRLYKIKVRNSINAKTTIEYPVLEIVENGEYDVQNYKGVKVNIISSVQDENETKQLNGIYDGSVFSLRNRHLNVSSLLDEQKLPLNIEVEDNNLTGENIVKDVNILGVTGTYPGIIPSGEKEITSTDSVDVSNYARARVVDSNLVAGNIAKDKTILGITGTFQGGITPTGELSITENGTYDVTQYASANVNVASSGGSGEITPESAIACLVTHPKGSEFGIIRPFYSNSENDNGFMPTEEYLESIGASGMVTKKLYYAKDTSGLKETDTIPSGSILIIEGTMELSTYQTEYNIYGLRGGNDVDFDDYMLTNMVNAINSGSKIAAIEIGFSTSDITSNSGNVLWLCHINQA